MTPEQIFRQHLAIRLKAPHEHAGKVLYRSTCIDEYLLFNGLGRPLLNVTPKDYVYDTYVGNAEERFVVSCGWLIDHQDQWEVTDERWTRIIPRNGRPTSYTLRSPAEIARLIGQELNVDVAPVGLTFEQIQAWNNSVPRSCSGVIESEKFLDEQFTFQGSGPLSVPAAREIFEELPDRFRVIGRALKYPVDFTYRFTKR